MQSGKQLMATSCSRAVFPNREFKRMLTYHPTTQPPNKPPNQLASQPANQQRTRSPTNTATNQPTPQPTSHPTKQPQPLILQSSQASDAPNSGLGSPP